MNIKNNERKKELKELNQQSNKNTSSIPSQSKKSSSGNGDEKSKNADTGAKSRNSDKNSSYTAKYSKNQVRFLNQQNRQNVMQADKPQLKKHQEPAEYGIIIKWRQGEIVGLGSSSVVYSAIRVDSNKAFAVKKFKVVSDITGIDQNKLKIIKVSCL